VEVEESNGAAYGSVIFKEFTRAAWAVSKISAKKAIGDTSSGNLRE
jgi:hypothetical protein